jgi:hypothetical protein
MHGEAGIIDNAFEIGPDDFVPDAGCYGKPAGDVEKVFREGGLIAGMQMKVYAIRFG